MKITISLLFCSALLLFGWQNVFAIPHHLIEIDIQSASSRLEGHSTITIDEPTEGPLQLLLTPRATIQKLHSFDRALDYTRSGHLLNVSSPKYPLQISWSLNLDSVEIPPPAHHEDPTYGVFARISPQGSYLAEGSNWHPRLKERSASHELIATLPRGEWAVTAGRLVQKSQGNSVHRIHWEADYPLTGLSLATGPWIFHEEVSGDIPVYAFFYKSSSSLASTYLAEARNYLNLYEELFGPYPFHKFAVVENVLPTGYGFPSWTLLGSQVVKLPFIVKTSLGHEIAHSWWGNGVHADLSQGNWAEGLTTYVADYLYKERKSDKAAKAYRIKILRDYATLVDDDAMPLKLFRSRTDKSSQAIGYGKSAMVFHQIRQRIGEEPFWNGLNHLATTRMFERIRWEHFFDEFSRQSGQDVAALFRPWIERGDIPELAVRNVKTHPAKDNWIVTGEIHQRSSIYPLNLNVTIETAEGHVETDVNSVKDVQPFSFAVSARPSRIVFDPESQVMRHMEKKEIPATVNSLRATRKLNSVVSPELTESQKHAVERLLKGLRKSPETAQGIDIVAGNDYLFSAPHTAIPSHAWPPGLTRDSEDRLLFKGEVIDPGAALFFVWQPPDQGVRALFVPGAEQSALRTAAKIPHYGKYSYLTFQDTENRMKGIWVPSYSPLDVSLQ